MKNTNNQLGLEASGAGANVYVSGGLVVLGFILYLNSISGEFLFDDWPLIKEDTLIHSLANWKTILIDGYRPVRTLLLAVFYHFFHLNPVWYHTANIIIHIFASIAVFHFILILVQHR